MTEQPEPRYRVTVERTSAGTFVARNRRGGEITFSTGDDGRWRICGVPRDMVLTARVASERLEQITKAHARPQRPLLVR